MREYKKLTNPQFDKLFTLVTNPRDGSTQFEWIEEADLPFIRAAEKECRLWTIVDCDGKLYRVAGAHFVNRLHYEITEQPHDKDYEVRWA